MFELLAAKPAGGAALDQVAIATGGRAVVTVVLLWLGLGHRSGKVPLLGRLGKFSQRVSGLPAWAAIPAGMIVVSLITALFGMLWDISLHIAQGRDEGPLANAAHYFILAGLFGVFASGFLSMCLPLEKPEPRRRADHRRLVRAARRRADHGLRRVLADRLPARRRLAPPVRPGRDALGPDAPDADRRRGDDARRPRGAARRGGRGQPRGRPPRRAAVGALDAPRLAAGRVPARALDVPGRVRLRRAAVPDDLPADADHARGGRGARRRADLARAAARRSARRCSSSPCAG